MTKLFKPCLGRGTIFLKAMPVITYIVFLFFYESKLSTHLHFMTSLPLLVPCVFFGYSFFKTYYTIGEEGYLFVQHGFAKKKVSIYDIESITSIKQVSFRQWFRTYALSTQGLSIRYGANDEIIVSPEEKDSFILSLKKMNSSIVYR